jgi:hypothetical protein
VYRTGLPFYDAARIIGVDHLFFGTASSEIEEKGAYWEVSGVNIERDEDQISWILNRIRPTDKEKGLFRNAAGKFAWKEFHEYFTEIDKKGRKVDLKAEYDVALQIGTRGPDPLSKYEILAPRSTGEKRKKFFAPFQEAAVATLGRGFAATVISRTERQTDTIYILPFFSEYFVLSGFLDFQRYYQHSAGGYVATVLAAISVLIDLTSKKIPVVDFVYTREVKGGPTPIFSESGYLGFEKLCNLWWEAVKEDNENRLRILKQIKSSLESTSNPNTDSQNKELSRHLAHFAITLDVDSLVVIEKLKTRILASAKNIYPVLNLFGSLYDVMEVRKMMEVDMIEISKSLVDTVAKVLSLEEGWMNKLTKLENASTLERFVTELERIVSRGVYLAQTQKIKLSEIHNIKNEDLENLLKIQEPRSFRAFKALFLLAVLGKIKIKEQEGSG